MQNLIFLLAGTLLGFNLAMIVFEPMVKKPDCKWANNMLEALDSIDGLSGQEEALAIKAIKEN